MKLLISMDDPFNLSLGWMDRQSGELKAHHDCITLSSFWSVICEHVILDHHIFILRRYKNGSALCLEAEASPRGSHKAAKVRPRSWCYGIGIASTWGIGTSKLRYDIIIHSMYKTAFLDAS